MGEASKFAKPKGIIEFVIIFQNCQTICGNNFTFRESLKANIEFSIDYSIEIQIDAT